MRRPPPARVSTLTLVATLLLLATCGGIRPAFPAPAAAGDWPMAAHDWQNTRFSPLADIDVATAPKLTLAWTFSTGLERGEEAAPIVVGGTMYVVTPYPNVL